MTSADRPLTTLVLLRVNHDAEQGYLSNYLPFLDHRLMNLGQEPIAGRPLQGMLKAEFTAGRLSLPPRASAPA